MVNRMACASDSDIVQYAQEWKKSYRRASRYSAYLRLGGTVERITGGPHAPGDPGKPLLSSFGSISSTLFFLSGKLSFQVAQVRQKVLVLSYRILQTL